MTVWLRAATLALPLLLALSGPSVAQTSPATTAPAADPAAVPAAEPAAEAPAPAASSAPTASQGKTYSEPQVVSAAKDLFGETTEGLAKVIEKVFAEMGEPSAYIAGSEFAGAIGVGLRYGEGTLNSAAGGSTKVYWQGPSIGFDLGGNASKVFVLVYNLDSAEQIFRRVPGVEGSYYFFAGVGVNYQSDGEVTLAPIRTGVGLRSGINIGYLHYSRQFSWFPF